jgi:hypothetical protein
MEFFPVPNPSGFRQMQFNIGFTGNMRNQFRIPPDAAAHQRLTMTFPRLLKINAVEQIRAHLATW